MIRRNSAIEKRASSVPTLNPPTSSTTLSNITMVSMSPPTIQTHTNIPIALPQLSHLNTTTISSDEQSISPALSSSTTTSPITPMTPISPHIQTGYQGTDMSLHPQLFIKNVSSSSVSAFSQHSSAHHRQNQQIHHHNTASGYHQRSPSKESYPAADNLPKLPPKPSLSGHICNNSGILFLT